MKADSSKETWILEYQGVGYGVEDEMIVFGGQVVGSLGGELTGHAQMDAEPVVLSKTKEHLFAMGLDGGELLPGQKAGKVGRVDSSEDPFSGVEMDPDHTATQPRAPLPAEIMDFGQLGHGKRVRGGCKKSKLGWGIGCDILRGWRRN